MDEDSTAGLDPDVSVEIALVRFFLVLRIPLVVRVAADLFDARVESRCARHLDQSDPAAKRPTALILNKRRGDQEIAEPEGVLPVRKRSAWHREHLLDLRDEDAGVAKVFDAALCW